MHRAPFALAALALTLSFAATAETAKPAAKPVAKAPAKVAKAAPAAPVEAPLGDAQLEIAQRVNTGAAACELNQNVHVAPVDGKPGFFKVAHGKSTYTMVPQETTTGAVRLEDRKTGHVWIQIPAKSMLMDSRQGRRLVDACQHDVQRTASNSTDTPSIGIVAAPSR